MNSLIWWPSPQPAFCNCFIFWTKEFEVSIERETFQMHEIDILLSLIFMRIFSRIPNKPPSDALIGIIFSTPV